MVDYKNVMIGAGNLVFCSLIAVWHWSEKLKEIQRFVIFDTFRRHSCGVRYLLRNYRLGSDNRVLLIKLILIIIIIYKFSFPFLSRKKTLLLYNGLFIV